MNTAILMIVWKQFLQRKLRSSLTVVGIVIGIAALISLILLSQALEYGLTSQFDSFGSDVILVAPKANLGNQGPSGVGKFTTADTAVIASVPQVLEVNDFVGIPVQIKYGRDTIRRTVNGVEVDEDFVRFINLDIGKGRYLSSSDRNAINVGYKFALEAFDKELFVGNSIEINGKKYTVVGIFAEEGDSGSDNIVYMPIESARDMIGQSDAVTAMSVRISPGADLEIVEERIINALERYRGEEDFATTTPDQIKEEIGGLLGVVNIIVVSIALISLFVASLGIMNSLYTSVLQRTKEIGTMKAVGATNLQIFSIFVLESAVLGAVGGLLGIIVGVMMAYAFIIPLNMAGIFKLVFAPDWTLFVGSFVFSVVLGVVAGSLPAIRAARLKPVDALRYE